MADRRSAGAGMRAYFLVAWTLVVVATVGIAWLWFR